MKPISLLFVLGILISACGSESTPQSSDNPISTGSGENFIWPGLEKNTEPDGYGYLLDSTVEGLRYISGKHYGVTDTDGKFGYISGESIEFYIGNSLIASASTPKALLTPLEFSDKSPFNAYEVLRLLQSLDDDGNPNNGIQISQAVHDLAETVVIEPLTISFDNIQPYVSFDHIDPDVIMELTAVTIAWPRAVVTGYDALKHFESTLDSLINDLENDIQSVAAESTCTSNDQCDYTELETRYTFHCPSSGPSIIFSTNDLDQLKFDALIAERKHLVELRK